MNCHVINDLLPLYANGECSDESRALVEEHLSTCPACAAKLGEIKPASHERKAAFLRRIVLISSAAALALGLALEAFSREGLLNGYWFILLAASAGALLASAASWYLGAKDKKAFFNRALIVAVAVTVCAYIAAAVHYNLLGELWFRVPAVAVLPLVINIEACIAAKLLAKRYAGLRGIK